MNKLSNSLDLHVLITTQNGKITSTSLTSSDSSSFTYDIVGDSVEENEQLFVSISNWINQFIHGNVLCSDLPLDWGNLTFFSRNCLELLRGVPFGSLVCYQTLAKRLGNKNLSRSVGRVCAINPFPLLIPCHRVISKSGKLGGFSQGIWAKKALIQFEQSVINDEVSIPISFE